MRWQEQLDPIHYDASLMLDLIERLEEYSEIRRFKMRVLWDGKDSEVTFDAPREAINSTSIPDRILSFGLDMTAEEGRINIFADSVGGREYHRLIVEGDDEEWVRTNLQNISEFEDRQRNNLRKWISNRHLRYLQLLLVGTFLVIASPYVLAYLLPAFRYPVPQEITLLASSQLVLIGLLEIPKRIYPYVVFTKSGEKPLHRTIISIVISLASVIGAILGLASLVL